MTIREFEIEDWEAVDRIYAEGIATGTAVFSEARPTWEEWDTSHLKTCGLVSEENGAVVCWTTVSKVSNR